MIPEIQYIKEETWNKQNNQEIENMTQQTHPDLWKIRQKARLTTLLENHPHTQYWLTADYAEQEIKTQ